MVTRLHTVEQAVNWLQSHVTGQLQTDSRRVGSGDGFIAWPGAAVDARQFVSQALEQGAAACLVEHCNADFFEFTNARIATFENLKAATGWIAAKYFLDPTKNINVVAVTGTNGKTSTAWWLAQALSMLEGTQQTSCAVVGTLGIGVPPNVIYNGLTTPDPVLLQQQFVQMVSQGVKVCAVEASSIGLAEHRLAGTQIRIAMWTNLSQDHLDYHANMADYFEAKSALFKWPTLQSAVINIDDAEGSELAVMCAARGLDVWTVAVNRPARLQAQQVVYGVHGLQFNVVEGAQQFCLHTHLIGQYNISNLLGVIAAMRVLGIALKDAVKACEKIRSVPGRMECISMPNQPLVAVDYAHTPDALEKALQALRPLAMSRGGALHCLFGCGGDRDASKRPLMAAMAEKNADRIVITSDNPRSEKPEAIVAQVLIGLESHAPHDERVRIDIDRARAIASALQNAQALDVVLIAGKGHEDFQEIQGVRYPFSDVEHATRALHNRTLLMHGEKQNKETPA